MLKVANTAGPAHLAAGFQFLGVMKNNRAIVAQEKRIAKARGRVRTTRDGGLKGKLLYMAPEQVDGSVDRRTDVYAAALVLWEALAGAPLSSNRP